MAITAESAAPWDVKAEGRKADTDLTANMEIRQEMIRLINQARRANGVSELPVNDALMDASQTISSKMYFWHHTQESKAAAAAGYP